MLLPHHKEWLRGKVESAWIWLDDQKAGKFLHLLRNRRLMWGFSLVFLFPFCLGWFVVIIHRIRVFGFGPAISGPIQISYPVIAVVSLTAIVVVLWKLHPRILDWILSTSILRQCLVRLCCAWLVCVVVGLTLMFVPWVIGSLFPTIWISTPNFLIFATLYVNWLTFVLLYQTGLLAVILFLSILWLVAVNAVILLFRMTQFILIRIVESPSGPVLGLSGLLIGIGALAQFVITLVK
jgi:hypothetical protein